MSTTIAQLESYLEASRNFRVPTAIAPSWLRDLARSRICALLLPWDFPPRAMKTGASPTSPHSRGRLSAWRAAAPISSRFPISCSGAWKAPQRDWSLLMGALSRSCRTGAHFPKALRSMGWAGKLPHRPDAVAAHFGRYVNIERDPFCALNTGVRRRRGLRACGPRRGGGAAHPSAVHLHVGRHAGHDSSAQPHRGGRRRPGLDHRGLRLPRRRDAGIFKCGHGTCSGRERQRRSTP